MLLFMGKGGETAILLQRCSPSRTWDIPQRAWKHCMVFLLRAPCTLKVVMLAKVKGLGGTVELD